MKSETIITWRFIKDHMIVHGLTPQSFCIDSPLIKSIKSAGINVTKSNKRKKNKKNEATIQ